MGIERVNPNHLREETEVTIVEQVVHPIIISSKKFYQTNPKEFLELVLFLIYLVLTLIGELVTRLPWEWYLVFCIFIVGYFNIATKAKKILKKGKK